MEAIGQKIKQARKDAGLSLSELGKRIGTSHVYLSQIENGQNLSIEVLIKIADGIGCDVRIDLIPKPLSKENNEL